MALSKDDAFNVEVLKLLLQLAWSDDQIDPQEANLILGVGRSWMVPEAFLDRLKSLLAQGDPLPAPDLALLRARPDDVLEAARALAATDGRVAEEEQAMIDQIRELLGVG